MKIAACVIAVGYGLPTVDVTMTPNQRKDLFVEWVSVNHRSERLFSLGPRFFVRMRNRKSRRLSLIKINAERLSALASLFSGILNELQVMGIMSLPLDSLTQGGKLGELIGRKLNLQRTEVILQMAPSLHTGNR